MKRVVDIVREKWTEKEKKQKSEKEPDVFDEDFIALVEEEGEAPGLKKEGRPPWMWRKQYDSLEQELGDFCLWILPTKKEKDLREETIMRLNLLVSQTFSAGEVVLTISFSFFFIDLTKAKTKVTCHNFGSYHMGLSLPGSDLDFVLIGASDVAANPLRRLASSIRNKRYASFMNVVENTRVPIIKYTDIKTSIDCDVSFDMHGGILMGRCFARLLKEQAMQHARKLVVLVKLRDEKENKERKKKKEKERKEM
jgi:DNA polymerase sigma